MSTGTLNSTTTTTTSRCNCSKSAAPSRTKLTIQTKCRRVAGTLQRRDSRSITGKSFSRSLPAFPGLSPRGYSRYPSSRTAASEEPNSAQETYHYFPGVLILRSMFRVAPSLESVFQVLYCSFSGVFHLAANLDIVQSNGSV